MAAVAFVDAVSAGAVPSYGLDNDRSRFRHGDELFGGRWDLPLLIDGQAVTATRTLDMALYSLGNETFGERWVDSMYPVASELDFDGEAVTSWCRRWWWMSYVFATLYLIGLWMGTSLMKERKPWDLKVPLALWNLFLAVFSFIGMGRTAPHLLMLLGSYGFEYTVCRAATLSYGNGPSGLWVSLFIFSKYFELIDTVFLVVRKKSVPFLHWYHHCSVLLYCWHAYLWEMPTGIYFVSMNYTVHAIMYFYYFLSGVLSAPPRWALLVTILQLSQMAVGITITLCHLRILIYGLVGNCDGHIPNLTAALGMYASYFILFAQFLGKRYCCGGRSRGKNGKSNGTNGTTGINGNAEGKKVK